MLRHLCFSGRWRRCCSLCWRREPFQAVEVLWLGLGCGAMAGLTISVKLTAVLLAATILAYAMLALILWLPRRSLVSAVAWRWSMLAVIVSMVMMVAMNPFLYPNPADRLQQMFAFRTQEMFGQAALSENEAVPPGLAVRLPLVAERTLVRACHPEQALQRATGPSARGVGIGDARLSASTPAK